MSSEAKRERYYINRSFGKENVSLHVMQTIEKPFYEKKHQREIAYKINIESQRDTSVLCVTLFLFQYNFKDIVLNKVLEMKPF